MVVSVAFMSNDFNATHPLNVSSSSTVNPSFSCTDSNNEQPKKA